MSLIDGERHHPEVAMRRAAAWWHVGMLAKSARAASWQHGRRSCRQNRQSCLSCRRAACCLRRRRDANRSAPRIFMLAWHLGPGCSLPGGLASILRILTRWDDANQSRPKRAAQYGRARFWSLPHQMAARLMSGAWHPLLALMPPRHGDTNRRRAPLFVSSTSSFNLYVSKCRWPVRNAYLTTRPEQYVHQPPAPLHAMPSTNLQYHARYAAAFHGGS